MTYPFGVDISRYQFSLDGKIKIDFDKLNPLVKFCGVRAGISWGYTDPWYTYTKAHLLCPRLDYHVVYPGEDATRQMDHFLRIVNPGEHDRLVLDLELDHGYSRYKITQTVISCLEWLRSETGIYPVIYSRASWVNQFLNVVDLPENLAWWLANYLSRLPYPFYTSEHPGPPTLPNGVNSWLLHQTGDRANGRAHGVASHYIDTDRWNGTEEEMLAFFGLGEESHEVFLPIVTNPEPEPAEFDGITLWSQADPRWAKDLLGYSYYTIEQMGCLLCCYAAVMKKLGYDTDPGRLNVEMKRIGAFAGNHRIYFLMPQRLFPEIERHYWWGTLSSSNFQRIVGLLDEGLNPMMHVDRQPYVPNMQEHWLTALDHSIDDLLVYDPYDGKVKWFSSEFGSPLSNIHRINCMRKKN